MQASASECVTSSTAKDYLFWAGRIISPLENVLMKMLSSSFDGWGPLARDSSAFFSGFQPSWFPEQGKLQAVGLPCAALVLASFTLHYSSNELFIISNHISRVNPLLYILPSRQSLICFWGRGTDKDRWQFEIVPLVDFWQNYDCREADLCTFLPSLVHSYTIPIQLFASQLFPRGTCPSSEKPREISFLVKNIERKKQWHAFQEHFRGWLKQNTIKIVFLRALEKNKQKYSVFWVLMLLHLMVFCISCERNLVLKAELQLSSFNHFL